MNLLWVLVAVVYVYGKWADGFSYMNETDVFHTEAEAYGHYNESKAAFQNALWVGLTLIQGAGAKGAESISVHTDLALALSPIWHCSRVDLAAADIALLQNWLLSS
ncbi:hypothetical protein Tsubulata_049691 [Turnera subulata]|uniref:Uncharacterized protein n=1 Tax=Turnera subulata TaxID=218843 RepID=A0A9Q0G015_9ROSI|nr:hypothetical protein Tsubulata_049691 [Turnera subulata]